MKSPEVPKISMELWLRLCGINTNILGSVEAGMIALNRNGTQLIHEDYVDGIAVV